ncbi:amino acid ABC transporter substrate-binding protein [Ligilactobacillus salitolerans]|uniref:Amino acid ABC transporter substrate-binding protein n=1 Tax=Ligilactobacillus salitolerans TaxID=1808352 RepID=A0A401IWH5_9LACO|nr:transporter substrate-binding domain-containing protein [Ligilactobacillus salitolerans]GBG95855.1 amino acid ABC transporter substrate-binding protein [Ligilactobacillus salitolerans]
MKTKKKLYILLAFMAMFTMVLTACGKKDSDQSVKKIQDKKTLVVGTSADYAPFEFPIVQNGKKKIVGYDMLLAQKIADKLDVKLKIVNTEFPSLISELKNNKVDLVMAGMVSTNQRKKAVNFSNSYFTVKNQVLVKKGDAAKFKDAATDFKGKSVGAQQTTTQEKIAKSQLKGANVVSESAVTSLTTELKKGKLDAVVVENTVANSYVQNHPNDYEIAPAKLKTSKEQSYINVALRKGDKKLAAKVNQVIAQQKKNGGLDKMLKKAQSMQPKD